MKLFFRTGNINSLKTVISTLETEANDVVEIVKSGPNSPIRSELPVLIDKSNGLKLFRTNAICLYLYERNKSTTTTTSEEEEWLQWESGTFYPIVVHELVKKSSDSPTSVIRLVKSRVETALIKSQFLTGEAKSLVDVIIWSDLYPLACFARDLFEDCPKTKIWFEKLRSDPNFVRGVEKLEFGKGFECCKSSISSLIKPPLPKNIQENDENDEKLNDSKIKAAIENWKTAKSQPLSRKPKRILPVKGERNILITSALPYVNNIPHLGNIIGCVLSADVFARFCRLRNYNTLFICGTDEHGTTTETKALAEGITPNEICEKYNKIHTQIYDWFRISFDHFGRTTSPQCHKVAQEIFLKLEAKGKIIRDEMEQLWCQACSRFLADRFVEGVCPLCGFESARGDQCDSCGKLINAVELIKPYCISCKATPVVKSTKHLFLDLPLIEKDLNHWYQKSSPGWTNNARVITKAWLKLGLQQRCITRDLKWGIPVPLKGYEDKVFYVWFDAPIGYIGITASYTDEWRLWWQNPEAVEYYQFMAKDNVPFHSVIFPSCLLGTGDSWTLAHHIMATEYLNYGDAKFSKSRGTGVFGNDAIDTGIPADIWRFYLLYIRPENQDSAFKWNDLMLKINSELLGNLGNFINRALKFCKDNFDGIVSEVENIEEFGEFLAKVSEHLSNYVDLLENCREREAISQLLSISRLGNQLMQSTKPWKLNKGSKEEKAKAKSIISLCVNTTALLSLMMEPYIPDITRKLRAQLNFNENNLESKFIQLLPIGHKIGTPEPLILEMKPEIMEAFEKKYSGNQESREEKTTTPMKTPSSSEDVQKKVGKQGKSLKAK